MIATVYLRCPAKHWRSGRRDSRQVLLQRRGAAERAGRPCARLKSSLNFHRSACDRVCLAFSSFVMSLVDLVDDARVHYPAGTPSMRSRASVSTLPEPSPPGPRRYRRRTSRTLLFPPNRGLAYWTSSGSSVAGRAFRTLALEYWASFCRLPQDVFRSSSFPLLRLPKSHFPHPPERRSLCTPLRESCVQPLLGDRSAACNRKPLERRTCPQCE